MQMSDYKERAAEQYAADVGLNVEDVLPALDDKLDTVEERTMEELDEQTKVDYALGMMNAEAIRKERTGVSGEPMDLEILSIGARGGVWDGHPATGKPTVTAHGVIRGPIGEDGETKAGKAIFLLTQDDLNLTDAQTKFHALNELKGRFEVESAWNLDGFYRVYSSDDTTLTEEEIDELPTGRSAKNDLLRKMFPGFDLADLAEDQKGLSATNEDGYTLDWGADIKRFQGTVQDYYINDDRTWGVYTLKDDSMTADDIEQSMLMGENQQMPGLSVHCEPDYHMNVGKESVVDVYGVTEVNDDGQIIMRAAGVVPIIPTDMDDGEEADENIANTKDAI